MIAKHCATALVLSVVLLCRLAAQSKPRARDLGVPFDGNPGPLNSITDVKGAKWHTPR
jgi:D-aminopeptidase